MKLKILILTFSIVSLYSCGRREDLTDISSKEQLQTEKNDTIMSEFSQIAEVGDKKINWADFQEVYSFIDSEGFQQMLGINRVKGDSIEFQLASISILCDMELHGKAIKTSLN